MTIKVENIEHNSRTYYLFKWHFITNPYMLITAEINAMSKYD